MKKQLSAIAMLLASVAFAQADVLEKRVNCLAEAIYFEARSESVLGQILVAKVIINRDSFSRRATNVCEVIAKPKQFSYVGTVDMTIKEKRAWSLALWIAHNAYDGKFNDEIPDRFKYVTHYHTDKVNPDWSQRLKFVGQVGAHKFYMLPTTIAVVSN